MIEKLIELLNQNEFEDNDSIFEYANLIEDFLVDNGGEMFEENYELSYYLEDSLLEICEPLEPGMASYQSFLEGKEIIRIKALKMLNNL